MTGEEEASLLQLLQAPLMREGSGTDRPDRDVDSGEEDLEVGGEEIKSFLTGGLLEPSLDEEHWVHPSLGRLWPSAENSEQTDQGEMWSLE